MRSSISYTLRLLALLSAFAAASCVNDNESDCPPAGQAEQYVLNLRITTQKASTRAEGHGQEEATDAEDRIDIEGQDFTVLVFDGYGRLIQRFEPSGTVIRRQGSGYDVTGVLGETSAQQIQVAVAANWRSMKGAYDRFILGRTSLSDMYGDGTTWNFTLPTGGWRPDGASATIPMYGCSGIVSLNAATQDPTDKERYNLDLGEIRMLRAVAKIEIVDCLPEGPEIDGNVTLSEYNATGRLIPDATENPDWNVEGKQVTSPTLPDATATAGGLEFFTETKTVGGKERTVYSVYVTEADIAADRPVVNLTVRDSGETTATYEMAVDEYTDGKATDTLAALLRNHVYRYEIRSVSGTPDINYTICPMGTGVADIPAFE